MYSSKRFFGSSLRLLSLVFICLVLISGIGCKSEPAANSPASQPAQTQPAPQPTPPPAPSQALPTPPPLPESGAALPPPKPEVEVVVKTPTEGLQKDAKGHVLKTRENLEKLREARKNAPTEIRKIEVPQNLRPQPDPSKPKQK